MRIFILSLNGDAETEAIFNGLSILKITNIKTKSSKPAKRCLIEFGKDTTTVYKIEELLKEVSALTAKSWRLEKVVAY